LAALRQLVYREAYAVTSNSSGILDKLAAYVPAGKLKLMPNPILVPSVEKDNVSKSSRFIAVARLVHQKGIDLLLEAFAAIADEVRNWRLEIVGDGPLRSELAVQARKLGIDNRVTFHGHLPDPMTILRLSRVFVLPSRFEGMPNALLEAMACGLAPIVTDASPGPLESIRHNETGLVVRSEDVAALAEAMRLLASDDGMTHRLAEQAGAYIKKHDWSVIEPQWLQVLGIGADEGAKKPLNLLSGGR
jgi:glycosyltransferase involved in cell wall biosynthesis